MAKKPEPEKKTATAPTAADAARMALYGDVGKRIREVREGLGVGQAECARGAEIDTSSMFRIESGTQNLTIDTLARLSLSLGVPMDDLLSGVEPDPLLVAPRTRG